MNSRAAFGLALGLVVSTPVDVRADSLSAEASATFAMTEIASNLQQLTDFRFLPDGRMVITQKTGQVIVRQPGGGQLLAGTLPVDSTGSNGLLGVAVDPAFAQNGFLYFFWSVSGVEGGTALARHRVSRFTLNGETLDLNSELVLIDDLMGERNPGGGLAIGSDGRLYVGVGDTGCSTGALPGVNVSNWFATCLSNANGKVLRVELDGGIPADNPLPTDAGVTACGASCLQEPDASVTAPARQEIFAWGFNNPTRLWFDSAGRLWATDQSEASFEELNVVASGQHHGWPLRAGSAGLDGGACGLYTPQTPSCTEPVYFCSHGAPSAGVDGNCTGLRGGATVDSCTWPAPWRGRLYFGDATGSEIAYLNLNAAGDAAPDGGFARGVLGNLANDLPMALQVGPDLNLYVGAFGTSAPGRIVRIAPISPLTCPAPDGGTDAGTGGDAGNVGADAGTGPHEKPGSDVPPASGPPLETSCGGCSTGVGALSAFVLLGLGALARRGRRRR